MWMREKEICTKKAIRYIMTGIYGATENAEQKEKER